MLHGKGLYTYIYMKHHSYAAAIRELKESGEVEIKSSIPAAEFSEAIKEALASLKEEATLPGFRKGSAPEKLVRERVGEAALLAEAAEHAIGHAYGHILEAEKVDAVGHPKVTITKMAEGNPLEFTVVTAVVPKIAKLDYKKIAAKENAKPAEAVAVADDELKREQEKAKDLTKEDLLKAKEYRAKEKRRLELVDALAEGMEVVIPAVLVESELSRMLDQMKHDIERMGLSFADYLKHLGKKEEDLKKEWKKDAEKRIKLDLALDHIAKAEKIEADKEKVDAEVKHAKEHYKDLDEKHARAYFEQILLNQAVFEFLEKQK